MGAGGLAQTRSAAERLGGRPGRRPGARATVTAVSPLEAATTHRVSAGQATEAGQRKAPAALQETVAGKLLAVHVGELSVGSLEL